MKIKIATKSAEALAELWNTKTASAIIEALPFESTAHRWGEEIYFDIPLELELEDGKEVLDVGDIAYWPPGKSHETRISLPLIKLRFLTLSSFSGEIE